MAPTTDVIPQVINYLITQAQANASLGAATPAVIIVDGQPATQNALGLNETGLVQRLWIGSSGYVPSGQMDAAAASQQGFAFLDQGRTRDNDVDIACAAEAISGDTVMSEARNGAFAVLAAVELMLRGSPGTNPASPGDASMGGLLYWAEVTGPIDLHQAQTSQGAGALVTFRVTGYTRLTS